MSDLELLNLGNKSQNTTQNNNRAIKFLAITIFFWAFATTYGLFYIAHSINQYKYGIIMKNDNFIITLKDVSNKIQYISNSIKHFEHIYEQNSNEIKISIDSMSRYFTNFYSPKKTFPDSIETLTSNMKNIADNINTFTKDNRDFMCYIAFVIHHELYKGDYSENYHNCSNRK